MSETFKNIIYMARRFKLATALNMMGLVVAFAAFYLFMTQIIYQVTYNRGIEDYERWYRLESNFVYNEWECSDIVCLPFIEALRQMPEVESMSITSANSTYEQRFRRDDGSEVAYTLTLGNNTIVSSFGGQVLDGSIEWNDSSHEGLIIPRSIAMDYFGTVNVHDSVMTGIYGDEDYEHVVRGVYEDFPTNSEIESIIYSNLVDTDTLLLDAYLKCNVKFKEVPKDMEAYADRLKQAIINYMDEGLRKSGNEELIATDLAEIRLTEFRFTPLENSYFEHKSFTSGDSGYRTMAHLLEFACVLAIILAAINFLNFTLAESPMRIRGLNTRRVLGARRRSIRLGLIGEGVVISFIACVLALLMCSLLQLSSFIVYLTEGHIALTAHPWLVLFTLAIAAIVGVVASYYPSAFSTSFPLSTTLKGNLGLTPRGSRLRLALVGLQLGISMLMVIYIGILFSQSNYIFNSPYGYNKEGLLVANLPKNMTDYTPENDTLNQVLSAIPGVKTVAFSEEMIGQTDGHSSVWTSHSDTVFKYTVLHVSQDYLRAMDIPIVEGRGFEPGDTAAIIINQATRQEWPWLTFGSTISTSPYEEEPDSAVVIGVCDNIRFGTTRINKDKPFLIVCKEGNPYLSALTVRVAADADQEQVKQQVNDVLMKRYGILFTPATYFNDQLRDTYRKEFRYVNQMVILAIICLIITLLGVFCITLFETEYRRKEIGIRKVAGATSGEIVGMFCLRYGWLLLVSFAIAAPLALYFGHKTLQYFTEHTAISWWWILPASLLLVGAITLGTVVLMSWRTAHENPVNSIKTE